MRIAICDDDPVFIELEKREIKKFFEERKEVCQISAFETAAALMEYLMTHPVDLIFMDVVLNGESGIDAASRIEKLYPDCHLAYCTNYLEYATEVYETKHCYYILKENFAKKLPNVIRVVLKDCGQEREKQKICVRSNAAKQFIYVENIMYAERNGKKTCLYLKDGNILEVSEKISELEHQLKAPDFVRCHNSFLISLSNIKEYRRQKVQMEDGTDIPISRPYINVVKEAFAEWNWQNN